MPQFLLLTISMDYIYIKKTDEKSLGWVWTLGKLCILRLKGEHINEFKIFWDK